LVRQIAAPEEPMSQDRHERLRRALEESAHEDADEPTKQRNAGVAIAVLALLVVGLLVAIVSGGMPRP
jgi:hypothetical protein